MRGTTVTFTALFGQQDGCFHDFAEYHDYSQPCVKLVVNMAEPIPAMFENAVAILQLLFMLLLIWSM